MIVTIAQIVFFLLFGLSKFVSIAYADVIVGACAIVIGIALIIGNVSSRKVSTS